jgi:antitoxin (DNA-binding transcriptional repressor) of toxin-antitoxin stability system
MKVVGIRELKNRLSEYIRLVGAGEDYLVTDRGEVVAELRRPSRDSYVSNLPPGLADLAARGKIRLGGKNEPSAYRKLPPIAPDGAAKRLLDEDRAER